MAEDTKKDETQLLNEEGFVPGTTYKSIDELIRGHQNLKEMSDRQGGELGNIRKDHEALRQQNETLANALKEYSAGKKETPKETKTDYDAELAAIDKAIGALDPMEDGYQKNLSELIAKSNRIIATEQHQKTLAAASEMMQKELNERDVKSAQESFYKDNPDFNTAEMQARIREYIAKDRTGMSDSLSAFREIQRDDIALETKRLMEENAEYQKRINLAEGTDKTGKVIVKGQSPGQPTKHTKVIGKDLDAGMLAALQDQSP